MRGLLRSSKPRQSSLHDPPRHATRTHSPLTTRTAKGFHPNPVAIAWRRTRHTPVLDVATTSKRGGEGKGGRLMPRPHAFFDERKEHDEGATVRGGRGSATGTSYTASTSGVTSRHLEVFAILRPPLPPAHHRNVRDRPHTPPTSLPTNNYPPLSMCRVSLSSTYPSDPYLEEWAPLKRLLGRFASPSRASLEVLVLPSFSTTLPSQRRTVPACRQTQFFSGFCVESRWCQPVVQK